MARPTVRVRPIEHLSLVDRVTDELHRAILNGDIPPGSVVSIAGLCEQFSVSHIPVREALRRLESEDLLSLRPGRSALVASLSLEDLAGIYRLRRLIEGDLAERTPAVITPASLSQAEVALERYAETSLEPALLAGAHHAFQTALLADVTGPAERRVLTGLWKSGDRYLHLLNDWSWTTDVHRTLLDLSTTGDGAALRDAWLASLGVAERVILDALSEQS